MAPAKTSSGKVDLSSAKSLLQQWRLAEALFETEKGIALAPKDQVALQLRTKILAAMGRKEEAIDAARTLAATYPLDVLAVRQLRALGAHWSPSPAVAFKAIEAAPGRVSRFAHAMHYLNEGELFDDALKVAELGLSEIESLPDDEARTRSRQNLLLGRGTAQEGKRQYEAALSTYEEVGDARLVGTNAARCLLALGRFQEAEDALRAARPVFEKFSGLTLEVLQAQGHIRDAYRLYRLRPISDAIATRFGTTHASELEITSGKHKSQRAFVVAEGGPGDEIRMASLYNELPAYFREVSVTCEPRLQSILRRNFPSIDFLPTRRFRQEIALDMPDRASVGDARLVPCLSDSAVEVGLGSDVVLSVLDLLTELRPNRAAFSSRPLIPDPNERRRWAEKMQKGRLNVGIAWRSLLQSSARNVHYLEAEDLAPLAGLKSRVHLWSLQPRASSDEVQTLRSYLPLTIPDLDLVDDFEGQLALMSSLDLIVAPFTTTGEMAGASGTPTMLISLAPSTIWRRGEDGSDLWHRNARVVAGSPIFDRESAVKAVLSEIGDRLDLADRDRPLRRLKRLLRGIVQKP